MFGGLNNSIYVSNPNQWVDILGLTEWKGGATQTSVLIGSYVRYNVTSQCVKNMQTDAQFKVAAAGIAIKGSSPVTIGNKFDVVLQDNYKTVNPKALQGAWGDLSMAATYRGGKGFGVTAVGEASVADMLDGGWNTDYKDGYGISAGLSAGVIFDYKSKSYYCKISEPVKCGPGGCFKKDPPRVKHDMQKAKEYKPEVQPPLSLPSISGFFPNN